LLRCTSPQLAHHYRRPHIEFMVVIGGAADMDGNAASTRCVANDPKRTCTGGRPQRNSSLRPHPGHIRVCYPFGWNGKPAVNPSTI
jgi:hypothetical protein